MQDEERQKVFQRVEKLRQIGYAFGDEFRDAIRMAVGDTGFPDTNLALRGLHPATQDQLDETLLNWVTLQIDEDAA